MCNLEKVVFLTAGGNSNAISLVKKYPGLFSAFAHHDPEAADAASELQHALDNGLCGYKILGPLVKTPLNDEKFFPVWQVCERNRIPVLIHFGILGGGGGIGGGVNIDPLILHDAAKAFPGVNFVIPHFGCGYVRELLQLMWSCHNVYVDTSGNNEWVRYMPYDLDIHMLFRKFYEAFGADRIIFGSDSEWFPRGYAIRYLLDQLRAARQAAIPETDIKKIFRDNALGLLSNQTFQG
jgi:predicted TIM-barrel fold metal-dependent hydrolase